MKSIRKTIKVLAVVYAGFARIADFAFSHTVYGYSTAAAAVCLASGSLIRNHTFCFSLNTFSSTGSVESETDLDDVSRFYRFSHDALTFADALIVQRRDGNDQDHLCEGTI